VSKVCPHRRHAARECGRGETLGSHGREPAFEILHRCFAHLAVAKCGKGRQVAAVGIDRARRASGIQEQQVALEVDIDWGVRGGHGARTDSAGKPGLLSRTLLAGVFIILLVAALPRPAQASQLLARNTTTERLLVSKDGRALVTYHAGGRSHRVLAWGAMNARAPSAVRPQVGFGLDYSGGWGRFGRPVWKTFRNACGPYSGPVLPWLVTACTAPDGSHWALQRWQRSQANFGRPPWKPGHGAQELRLSHWKGPVAHLDVWLDWSYSGRWHHLFGRLTYRGLPVHGFSTTPTGDPLDSYGRVIYIDAYDSAYGEGWRRENGFVARRPDGSFCYGFVPHRLPSGQTLPPGRGSRYRLATSGPGVTPDVAWEGAALHDFRLSDPGDRAHEEQMNDLQRQVAAREPCHP